MEDDAGKHKNVFQKEMGRNCSAVENGHPEMVGRACCTVVYKKNVGKSSGENLKNGIYEGFKGLANKVVDVLNNVISSLESMLNTALDGINDLLSKLNESPLGKMLDF